MENTMKYTGLMYRSDAWCDVLYYVIFHLIFLYHQFLHSIYSYIITYNIYV